MGRKIVTELVFIALSFGAFAQTKPPVQQKADKSPCSNIVALTGNIDIKCSALTPGQSKAILSIQTMVRKLVAKQIDPNVIIQMNNKLDELLTKPSSQGSITQSNSGGVNIQQGSTGSGSPIIDSPINVGVYPPRHISSDWVTKGVPYLSVYPAQVLMLYPASDGDAYTYAKEIAEMLKSAGWTINGPNGATMMSSGGPEYGISVTYKGEKVVPNQNVKIDSNNSWGRLLLLLEAIQNHSDVYADPEPGVDENHMTISVNANPKAKPQ